MIRRLLRRVARRVDRWVCAWAVPSGAVRLPEHPRRYRRH